MSEFRFPPIRVPRLGESSGPGDVPGCESLHRPTQAPGHRVTNSRRVRPVPELADFEREALEHGPPGPKIDKLTARPCIRVPCIPAQRLIIDCDDRTPGPNAANKVTGQAPWQHFGRVSTGGSGTVIDPRFVLTNAHVLVGPPPNLTARQQLIAFSPGRTGNECAYVAQWGRRIFIPNEFSYGPPAEISRCYDWALLELRNPTEAPAMKLQAMNLQTLTSRSTFTIGYPGSLAMQLWTTGGQRVLSSVEDADGGGGLLKTEHDAEGGQSGAGMYTFNDQWERVLVGVLVGQPNCTPPENWAAWLTGTTIERIQGILSGMADAQSVNMTEIMLGMPSPQDQACKANSGDIEGF